jgi:hypothetical protein
MPNLHIYVHTCGSKQWPRFLIRNNRGQLWSGDGWTEKPQDALLFNSDDEASAKVGELMLASTERMVVTTVAIRVDREKPFTIVELQKFLEASFRGFLLDGDFGGARIEVQPDFDELREIE